MKRILACLCLFLLVLVVSGCAGGPAAAKTMVTLHYEENAQVEIIDSAGQRVLVDVYDPHLLSAEPTDKDILLTTHNHSDHQVPAFLSKFPGRLITMQSGKLTAGDVKIHSFAGSHNGAAPEALYGLGSNYVFLIEIGGLRIGHFGDLGQDALTPAQLESLGRVDVAIMQLANSYSGMSADNKKGFNLADQVKPRIIIPTHADTDALQIAVEKWKGAYSAAPLTLTAASLPKETTIIFVGDYAQLYGKAYQLPEWGK